MARIVLVHGAWGQASSWAEVAAWLAGQGHAVEAVDLPGHGADPTPPGTVTLEICARSLAGRLKNGPPAVLVGHSMGGMVISAAAEQVPEAVRHLVYVAAFLPRDGDSLTGLKRREPETIGAAIRRGPVPGTTVLDPEIAAGFLFQDAAPEVQRKALAQLGPEANAVQTDRVRLTGDRFGQVPRSYVLCTRDRTVTPWLQNLMAKESPCREVRRMVSGHCPHLSHPHGLAALLSDLAETVPMR